MRRFAGVSLLRTRPPSTCSSPAIRAARTGWRGRSCAAPRTRATSRRKPSCACIGRPGAFAATPRFSTWFYRILVNLCLDHQRRGRWWQRLLVRDDGAGDPERGVLERQPAPVADPGDALGRQQVMARLWAAVDRLSPQQRAAILLHVQEELPTSQIAEVLKCSEATVRVHLHRAVGALRKIVTRD